MKKLLICILFMLVIPVCLLFTGCGTPKTKDYSSEDNNRFFYVKSYKIDGEDRFYILVDKETNIMYLCREGCYSYAMTALLDSYGKPMIYEGEIE